MNLLRFNLLLLSFAASATILPAQTLYVPGGTIGTSANGNVGIGTTSPSYKLDVLNSQIRGVYLWAGGTGTSYDGRVYVTDSTGATKIYFGGALGESSYIITGGNVGIGTTTPNYGLEINCTFGVTGTVAAGGYGAKVIGASGADRDVFLAGVAGLSNGFTVQSVSGVMKYCFNHGNVGIGTTSPSYKLDVLNSQIRGVYLWAGGTGTSYDGRVYVTDSTGATKIYFGGALGESSYINTGGNVGIGTTSPGIYNSKMDVVTGASPLNVFAIRTADVVQGSAGSLLYLGLGATTGNTYGSIRALGGGGTGVADLVLQDGSGNVGIGTTNPTQKLSVNGTVRAKEVVVDTGWSDYVFKPDYALAPLSEVEAHIKAHGTLPGVPSEAQVAKEGISLGDMQAKLLAKIEELTLHQIAQEKEIKALKAELKQIKP